MIVELANKKWSKFANANVSSLISVQVPTNGKYCLGPRDSPDRATCISRLRETNDKC